MGGCCSKQRKTIYLTVKDRVIVIDFMSNTRTQRLKERIASAAGLKWYDDVALFTRGGVAVPIKGSMPCNTYNTSYKIVKQEALQQATRSATSRATSRRSTQRHVTLQLPKAGRGGEDNASVITAIVHSDVQQPSFFSSNPLDPKIRKALKSTTFDMWDCTDEDLVIYLEHMFYDLGLLDNDEDLIIIPVTFRRWLYAIQTHYNDNAFHNFRHAFSVTQMMYCMIHATEIWEDIYDKVDLTILLIAALCHDLDHPGLSNSYQVNKNTTLARKYRDSFLERHHCDKLKEILEEPDFNIFAEINPHKTKFILERISSIILSTDMKRNEFIVGQFQEVIQKKGFCKENPDHKMLLMKMLVKGCDISNELRPREIANTWMECLLDEYYAQSDLEKKQGLPSLSYMTREADVVNNQIQFIKHVQIPLYASLTKVLPELGDVIVEPLFKSLRYYEGLASGNSSSTSSSS